MHLTIKCLNVCISFLHYAVLYAKKKYDYISFHYKLLFLIYCIFLYIYLECCTRYINVLCWNVISLQLKQWKCGKLYLQALLVTNSRENWLCLCSKVWHVKYVHVVTDVQVHLFVAHIAGKQLVYTLIREWNIAEQDWILAQNTSHLNAGNGCGGTLEMSFQKCADSWGVQERRACNFEGVCDL